MDIDMKDDLQLNTEAPVLSPSVSTIDGPHSAGREMRQIQTWVLRMRSALAVLPPLEDGPLRSKFADGLRWEVVSIESNRYF
jgi:hypothetical protein